MSSAGTSDVPAVWSRRPLRQGKSTPRPSSSFLGGGGLGEEAAPSVSGGGGGESTRAARLGHDHSRSAGGDGVQPVLLGDVGADDVGVGALGDQALAGGGDGGEVDVVPVDGGWRGQALESSVEADAQVEPDRVGVAGQEVRGDLVQLLGPEGDAEDEVGFNAELAEVVVDGADDLVGPRRR